MVTNIILLKDGNRGHEKQLEAFISYFDDGFFRNILSVNIHKTISIQLIKQAWGVKKASGGDIWVAGAGHRTHFLVALLKMLFNWKGIVIMKPSLPTYIFNLCVVPEHDKIKSKKNIIFTKGPLVKYSKISPSRPSNGLILVGGVNRHFKWSSSFFLKAISQILKQNKHIEKWIVTSSRRTPKEISVKLKDFVSPKVTYLTFSESPVGWLEETLSQAKEVWVTADSMSMSYEALSHGCKLHLIKSSQRNFGSKFRNMLNCLEEYSKTSPYISFNDGKDIAKNAVRILTTPKNL